MPLPGGSSSSKLSPPSPQRGLETQMANPQCEDGYTRIANETIDNGLARVNLSPCEYRILWTLWRKTYGFGKTEDTISLTQFEKYTGMERRNVKRTINTLVSKNIILEEKKGYINTYGFNKNYESWRIPPNIQTSVNRDTTLDDKTSVSRDTTLVSVQTPELVSGLTHTKEKRNYTKEIHTFSQTENSGKGRGSNLYQKEAEDILSQYPKISARDTSLRSIVRLFKKGVTKESLLQAVNNYSSQIKKEGTEKKYILQSNNFFGQQSRYKDYLGSSLESKKLSPIDIAIKRCKERGDY